MASTTVNLRGIPVVCDSSRTVEERYWPGEKLAPNPNVVGEKHTYEDRDDRTQKTGLRITWQVAEQKLTYF